MTDRKVATMLATVSQIMFGQSNITSAGSSSVERRYNRMKAF